MRILLVEDEQKVADFIKKGLSEESYTVDLALNGEDGVFIATNTVYDLIILDILLPDINGIDVCKKIREQGITTPIMMLTAVDNINSKVDGLDKGADDYITKPFSFAEFLARVRALLRRSTNMDYTLKIADLVLDPVRHEVRRGDKKIECTAKEFALLEFLMRNKGKVLSRTVIFDHLWGYDVDISTNIVDVYISYIRYKIDKNFLPKLIHTKRGVGYCLKEEA